jgi:hypothetical protein
MNSFNAPRPVPKRDPHAAILARHKPAFGYAMIPSTQPSATVPDLNRKWQKAGYLCENIKFFRPFAPFKD